MDENKKLEFRGSSFMALVPFAIFIVITIALSFFNAADTKRKSDATGCCFKSRLIQT